MPDAKLNVPLSEPVLLDGFIKQGQSSEDPMHPVYQRDWLPLLFLWEGTFFLLSKLYTQIQKHLLAVTISHQSRSPCVLGSQNTCATHLSSFLR